MALNSTVHGVASGIGAEVDTANQLRVVTATDALGYPGQVGAIRGFSENDAGAVTGVTLLRSPEVDMDYRVRAALDTLLDEYAFTTTAQDTGKHSYATATLTYSWTAGQLTTNSGSTVAVNTGATLSTYAYFPLGGVSTTSVDMEVGFSASPQANSFVEFGLGLVTTSLVAPSDGVFFRLNSAGLQGVASFNGTETSTGVFPATAGSGVWAYTLAKRYQFILYISDVEAQFWVNDGFSAGAVCLATLPLPAGQGRMSMSRSGQFIFKHRIVGGAAGGVLQASLGGYSIRSGGAQLSTTLSEQGNRVYGSYQGLSGGTMGSLARFGTITTGNEADPAAAVPTTTTAALGTGLGGKFLETASLAVNTDGIIMSYQVPAATVNAAGRRLCIRGVYLRSFVQAVIVGGPFVAQWFLAFGHTNVSLATAEAVGAKAPRRIPLPFTQLVTAAQAVTTLVAQEVTYVDFSAAPVYVNPGEFVQLCTRHIGTVATSGVLTHNITLVYGWE
jgi:hypothetical protein